MTDPVEVMARAAYERVSPLYGGPWGSKPPQERDSLILDMRAALSALDAAGFAVVPKEPTEEMLEASVSPRTACLTNAHIAVLKDGFAAKYRAMLKAARPQP